MSPLPEASTAVDIAAAVRRREIGAPAVVEAHLERIARTNPRLNALTVVFEDRVEYRKELRLLQHFSVGMQVSALSEDGAKFIMVNEVLNPRGELCARVVTSAAWFSLETRKVAAPPPGLKAAMEAAERTEDFRWL